jgi:hypothetical protein
MKYKLTLFALLIPTAVFAQAGKSSENAGYQSTTSATQGLGASNPNAGGVGTVPPSTVGGNQNPPSAITRGEQRNSLPPGSEAATAPISVDPRPVR